MLLTLRSIAGACAISAISLITSIASAQTPSPGKMVVQSVDHEYLTVSATELGETHKNVATLQSIFQAIFKQDWLAIRSLYDDQFYTQHNPDMKDKVEGVIELLRKRGYTVEPMMPKVTKKSHALRDEMDQKRKPVQFVKHTSSDSLFTVQLPGKLFPILQFGNISYLICPDMVNGNFFTVVRYKHQAPLFHSSAAQLKATVDSLLFENIPGKILSKTEFTTATGIAALDVLSKTRNGDEQRYHLYFTDLEMLLFKLGGRGNYASGAEAKQFFSSIQIQALVDKQVLFSPPTGGFKVKIPANYRYHNNDNSKSTCFSSLYLIICLLLVVVWF